MEMLGNDPSIYYTSVHSGTKTDEVSAAQANSVANTSGGYHTYGVDWEPDHITYYFDGQQVYQTPTPWDMNTPMYMIANMASGVVSIMNDLRGPNVAPVTACSTGANAIGDAYHVIKRGDAVAMVAWPGRVTFPVVAATEIVSLAVGSLTTKPAPPPAPVSASVFPVPRPLKLIGSVLGWTVPASAAGPGVW